MLGAGLVIVDEGSIGAVEDDITIAVLLVVSVTVLRTIVVETFNVPLDTKEVSVVSVVFKLEVTTGVEVKSG